MKMTTQNCMRALGAEIHAYIAEQNAILLAQIDARMAGQSEILNSIKELQSALTTVMLAPRMLVKDERETDRGENPAFVIELRRKPFPSCAGKRVPWQWKPGARPLGAWLRDAARPIGAENFNSRR